MPAIGSPKFDAIAVTTIAINLLDKTMSAKAAFVDTRTGKTHGWTEGMGMAWSEETKQAIATLAELVEQDLGRVHFSGMPETRAPQPASRAEPGGLGEHLAEDAPSV